MVNQQLTIGDILEPDEIFKTETGLYFLEEPDPEAKFLTPFMSATET